MAFVPGVLGFTGRDQVTGGRTTALLVDRKCNQGRCRVWIGAAGGGVWRTEKGLHKQPRLEVLIGRTRLQRLQIAGQDPNDEDGDTLYAGTGEPMRRRTQTSVGPQIHRWRGELALDFLNGGDRGHALDRQDCDRPTDRARSTSPPPAASVA